MPTTALDTTQATSQGADQAAALPARVATAADAAAEAFQTAMAVWARAEAGSWRCVYRAREQDRQNAVHEGADTATLERVIQTGEAADTESEGQRVAVIPLPSVDGTPYAGVFAPRLSELEQINRIAADAAARDQLSRQVTELHIENDSFAVQLTSDLEELSFLRSVVDRMSASTGGGLLAMAKQTLPVLNTSVRAETLALLTSGRNEGPPRVRHQVGVKARAKTLRAIVDRFGRESSWGPVVKNWTSDAIRPDDAPPEGVRSIVCAPVETAGRQLGWLVAINRQRVGEGMWESSWQLNSDEFGSGEATLMTTTASILAIQAANMEMLHEKEQIMVNVVRSLVSAIEAKDEYTRGHSERVALYTRRLAEEMGYLEDECERIYLAALLHDVGKIGVSDSTLKKPGKLTSEEYAEISKHPDEGWAILCDLKQLKYVLPGVLHHHERWDGRGYPDGLAAGDIPLDGRVMAVADAYDAMTSDRPYRPGMPTAKAESIIRDGAGVQWDPACVDSFFACLEDLHAIKAEYRQRERRLRKQPAAEEERANLPHEVTGLPG
ncbi:MAG: HD-GYP domain-containing protein [Planctomycetota bacterium]